HKWGLGASGGSYPATRSWHPCPARIPLMFLYRVSPGHYAVAESPGGALRILRSDPFRTPPERWELGYAPASSAPLAPVVPGKIVGIGRNYKEHVKELNNPMPAEPVLFLKAT